MPLPRVPHIFDVAAGLPRRIVDPREFWENVLHLARLINGGLGVENFKTAIGPSLLEAPSSSFIAYFDVDSTQADFDETGEPLIQLPFDAKLVSVTVLEANVDQDLPFNSFIGSIMIQPGNTELANLKNWDQQTTYTVTPQDAEIPANSSLELQVAQGTVKGIVLEFTGGHAE